MHLFSVLEQVHFT